MRARRRLGAGGTLAAGAALGLVDAQLEAVLGMCFEPTIGQECENLIAAEMRESHEHVVKIRLRVDVQSAASRGQGVEDHGCFATTRTAKEEVVLLADHGQFDRPFRGVIFQRDRVGLEEASEASQPLRHVLNRATQRMLRSKRFQLRVHPRFEFDQHRARLFLPQGMSLVVRHFACALSSLANNRLK